MGGRGIAWGIVGFGWVARDYAAPGILAAGGRIAAVSDPSPAARNAAASLGARPCSAAARRSFACFHAVRWGSFSVPE